jgi:hypothetical protein
MMNSPLARRTRIGRGRPNLFGRRRSARPRLELLEERTLLSTWTVTDNSDSPTDTRSLRYAIANAPSGDTINFAATVTSPIVLTHGALTITRNLDIEGPGPQSLTIDGNNRSSVFETSSSVTATIAGLTIEDGKARDGAGIDIGFDATLTVKNCNIANNSATGPGGGIRNDGTLTLIDSTVSGNSAGSGGGIYDRNRMTVTNSTFWGNSATGYGGGIDVDGFIHTYVVGATLINCTLSANFAANGGGGIYTPLGPGGSRCTIANTIIAGNKRNGGSGSGADVFGSRVLSRGHNLIGNTSGSEFLWKGTDLKNVNALLAPLGNYGGPTQTIALLPGSPAIDAGADSIIGVTVPATDQRGKPRLTNRKIDIGAFQSQGFTIAAVLGSNQSASLNLPFAAPLVVSVTSAHGEPVAGGVVTFTAPQTGDTCTFRQGINTAVIDASGLAAIDAAAGGTPGGPYTVSARTAGASVSADFRLSNSLVARGASAPRERTDAEPIAGPPRIRSGST